MDNMLPYGVDGRSNSHYGVGFTMPINFSDPPEKKTEEKLVCCDGCKWLMSPSNPDNWNCESGCLLCEDCGVLAKSLNVKPPNGYMVNGCLRKEVCPCCKKKSVK